MIILSNCDQPILKRLQMKAQQAYRNANSRMPPNIPNDIFKPSQPDDGNDELSIFSEDAYGQHYHDCNNIFIWAFTSADKLSG
jgi:hypothetical protein